MPNKLSLLLLIATVAVTGCSQEPVEISKAATSQAASSTVSQSATVAAELENNPIYKEGVHYRVVNNIDTEGAKAPFLVEYFWLGCPHCQAFEAPLDDFIRSNPDFEVLKKPAGGGARWTMDAQIYYALKQLGKLEHLDGLFDLYRDKPLPSKTIIGSFLQSVNIDPNPFFEMAGTNAAISARANKNISEMRANEIKGVPGIVVNGKYLVIASDDVEFFALVKYLANK